jgi:hypothetical protein
MAGDWMKLDHDTPEKPEVMALAARLGISTDDALGKCVRFWRWFDRHTTRGFAKGVTITLLDQQLGSPGLCDALENVGWLIRSDDGIRLPHFERHNGATAKARALDQKRKRRGRGAGNEPDTNRTNTRTQTGNEPDTNRTNTRTQTGHKPDTEPEMNRKRTGREPVPEIEIEIEKEKRREEGREETPFIPRGEIDDPQPQQNATNGPREGQTWQAWLSDEWAFHVRGTAPSQRDTRKLKDFFEELIRIGFRPELIRDEIRRKDRAKTEPTWDFEKRLRGEHGSRGGNEVASRSTGQPRGGTSGQDAGHGGRSEALIIKNVNR